MSGLLPPRVGCGEAVQSSFHHLASQTETSHALLCELGLAGSRHLSLAEATGAITPLRVHISELAMWVGCSMWVDVGSP